MNEADALDLASASVWAVLACGGPAVGAAMAVGVVIAFFQALTQIQEATLTFVPKMAVVCVVLGLSATSIGSYFSVFTEQLYGMIATGYSH